MSAAFLVRQTRPGSINRGAIFLILSLVPLISGGTVSRLYSPRLMITISASTACKTSVNFSRTSSSSSRWRSRTGAC